MRQWVQSHDHETTIGEVRPQTLLVQSEGNIAHVCFAVPIENWQHSPETDWWETFSHGRINENIITLRHLNQECETSLERSELRLKNFQGFLPTGDQLPRTTEERIFLSFCHKLVDIVPREGYKELAEALIEIIGFYQPVREERTALPPDVTSTEAVYGEMVESPPFFVDFDEG